jgi:hypothetical protein
MTTQEDEVLYIYNIDGQGLKVPFLYNMSGKQVKVRLKVLTGYSIDQQILVFNGREIADNDKLPDQGVTTREKVIIFFFFFICFFFLLASFSCEIKTKLLLLMFNISF